MSSLPYLQKCEAAVEHEGSKLLSCSIVESRNVMTCSVFCTVPHYKSMLARMSLQNHLEEKVHNRANC